MKTLKEQIVEILEIRTTHNEMATKILSLISQDRKELCERIEGMAMLNADSGWYDKAITDVLALIQEHKE